MQAMNWTRSRSWFAVAGALAALTPILACGTSDSDSADGVASGIAAEIAALETSPRETFHWSDQPLSFAPLAEPWERNREQSGGQIGVYFVKKGSVGERIGVGEYYRVGRRDRCVELVELLRDVDTLTQRDFAKRLQRARPYAAMPIHAEETVAFDGANEVLDRARDQFREEDLEGVRHNIAVAIQRLSWVEYDLDEVVDDVLFTGEGWEREGEIDVQPPRDAIVAGLPAKIIDFTHYNSWKGRLFHGREVYFVHGNHLFTAGFLGLEENLVLFDAVLETITFPKGECVR